MEGPENKLWKVELTAQGKRLLRKSMGGFAALLNVSHSYS